MARRRQAKEQKERSVALGGALILFYIWSRPASGVKPAKVRSTFNGLSRALHLAALRLRTQRFAQRLGQGPLECAGAFRRAKPPRRSVSPEVPLRRSALLAWRLIRAGAFRRAWPDPQAKGLGSTLECACGTAHFGALGAPLERAASALSQARSAWSGRTRGQRRLWRAQPSARGRRRLVE